MATRVSAVPGFMSLLAGLSVRLSCYTDYQHLVGYNNERRWWCQPCDVDTRPGLLIGAGSGVAGWKIDTLSFRYQPIDKWPHPPMSDCLQYNRSMNILSWIINRPLSDGQVAMALSATVGGNSTLIKRQVKKRSLYHIIIFLHYFPKRKETPSCSIVKRIDGSQPAVKMTGESVLFDLIYLLMLRMNERRRENMLKEILVKLERDTRIKYSTLGISWDSPVASLDTLANVNSH